MSELGDIQHLVGRVLIPEAREAQSYLPSQDESLPIALELYYTALAMKPQYRHAGIVVARRFAERMGLNGSDVEDFAVQRIRDLLEGGS